MKTSAKQYAQALFLEIQDSKDLSVTVENFSLILRQDNCFSKMEKIIYHFNALWQKNYSLVEAEVISSYPLDSSLKDGVVEYLKSVSQAKEVNIEERKNRKILGGVVIKYGDKIVDASLKNKINILKNNLMK